ncbi:MAG: pyridoxal phosphate-dependent aminotransferase [Gaiella sp.]
MRFSRLVAGLPVTVPFVGPEALERARGRPFRARLGSNESAFGASAEAVAAMTRAAAESWMYNDPESHALHEALAAHLGIGRSHVVVGEGVDALLGYTVRALVDAGDPVVTSHGSYPTFTYHLAGHGAEVVAAPYHDDREDLDALLAAVRRTRARLVYLANPDNPMGSWWTAADVERFVRALPGETLLVLDEAYAEFAPAGVTPEATALLDRALRFRTFSKVHGMAGARVGYAFGPVELVERFEAIRNHFAVNRVAQAGALAALADTAHVERVLREVEEAKARIGRIAVSVGLAVLPSATNFVAVDCGTSEVAKALRETLAERDVYVRMPGVAPLDRCIRVTAALADALDVLETELPGALAEARATTTRGLSRSRQGD